MADLLARFKLVDEMSDKLGRMAESGQDMASQFERAGAAANAAFDNISGGVSSAVSSVDGVATSIDSLQSSVDNWTSAVGNYDRSALEAIYSTEELVEMGLKSADALEEQQRMFELCEQSAQALGKSMDATADIQEGLSNAIEQSDKAIKSVTNNEKVSAEAKVNLAEAAEKAAEAMNELEQAQQEADAAMEAYDRTMASGTTDLNQLEAAAERAGHAAEALAEANGKASDATEELSKATEQANEEAEQGGKSGKEAIEGIASALAAAGITATLKEISGAVYELADSFSEAEKIIVGATGATGQELDNLMASATNVFANSNAESLNEVAAGMTSVQRATGLTGEALEEATNAGLVLNNVLGYEVSESSRTASALMKNFGLSAEEAYNLIVIGAQQGADRNGDLLDVLNEYAPQYAALGLSAQEFLSSLVDGADAGVFSMAYAQSGSEEAAGLAASMASAIKNGNEEAVAELANTVGEVQAAQEQTAAAVADWQTDFTAQMDAIEQEMQTTIDGMNLSDEAAASASATITSYADKIRAGKSGAVAAAQEVANAVSAALSSANANINVSVNSSGVPGHARGTTNAESLFLAGEQGPELVARPAAAYASGTTDSTDYFIAGENGPELIVGEQGSTVFPTEETDRLINALNDKRRPLQVFSTPAEAGADKATEQVKRILLEIAGSGAIEVNGNGGADRATILEILTEHLKPVLMKIIQSEIYEEGELSYEY